MKFITMIFISYEIFKLIKVKNSVNIYYTVENKKKYPASEMWQGYLNLLYLGFMIVMFFFSWQIALAMIVLSIISSILIHLARKSIPLLTTISIADPILSIGLMSLYILR